MTVRTLRGIALIILCVVGIAACASREPLPPAATGLPESSSPYIIRINDATFPREVTAYSGPVVVLFFNDTFPQSQDMAKRIRTFAEQYYTKVKFCEFYWDVSADTRPYSLEMLPTVVLYDSGSEVDRIKGIPPGASALAKFNEDIELWLLKTAMQLKGDEYSADYTYKFNNGYSLNISNY